MKYILYTYLLLCFCFPQSTNDTIVYHDSLSIESVENKILQLHTNVRNASNDIEMRGRNEYLKDFIYQALKRNDIFNYPFSKLNKIMSTIYSDDKQIRVFNWNLLYQNHSSEYFCYLLHKNNGVTHITELKDQHQKIRKPGYKKLNEHKWYGALYYQIVHKKIDNQKYYYFLGWNGLNGIVANKIIEPVYFQNNTPVFGKLQFYIDQSQYRRIVFEYKSDLSFALRYDTKKDAFIFDHLEPMHESMIGIYEYYINTGVYNSFALKKNKWIFKYDISMKNNGSGIADKFNKPLNIIEINIKK